MNTENKDRKYYFVGGSGRSGTTLLRALLNLHEKLSVAPELRYFDFFYSNRKKFDMSISTDRAKFAEKVINKKEVRGRINISKEDVLSRNPQDFKEFFMVLLELTKTKSTECIVEKTPTNIFFIDTIFDFFPKSKFIHIVRDGREFCASAHKNDWYESFYQFPAYWAEVISSYDSFSKKYDDNRLLEIKYADLTNDTLKTVNKVFDFLEVEKKNRYFLDQLDQLSSSNSSFSSTRNKSGVYHSKHFEDYFDKEDKEKINIMLKDKLIECGYPVDKTEKSGILCNLSTKLIFWLYRIKIKLFFFVKKVGYFWVYSRFTSKIKSLLTS
ncbi:MAG: sulfotransferase [Candidatus Magasanikbacteria bacterium]